MIKKAKFSGYCFYMNTNLQGDFRICISVPVKEFLVLKKKKKNIYYLLAIMFTFLLF